MEEALKKEIINKRLDGRVTGFAIIVGSPVELAAARVSVRSCEHTLQVHFARTLLAAARVGVRSCEEPLPQCL